MNKARELLCIVAAALLIEASLFGGFQAGTLVKSGSEYIPIEYLSIGDVVDCCG